MSKTRRLPAEWEPQSFIQITFPHENSDWKDHLPTVIPCFVKIIETICQFQKVVVGCRNLDKVAPLLKRIPLEKLSLVEVDSNDTWARDHCGITIFENEKPVVLDFIFNGWGLKFAADKDNLITQKLFDKAVYNAEKLVKRGLVLEGGSIESDGNGTILTTTQCLLSPNRNPHLSQKSIEKKLKKWLGAKRVLWLENGYLAGDDTDSHIDTLVRFCNDTTLAYVACTDKSDEHFTALNEMLKELRNFKTDDGDPYNLIALPMPDACYDADGDRLPATYANFLIINGAVLVPTYGVPQDELAIAQIKRAFPTRKVVGIDCKPLILQHGSLHCITMQFP